VERQLAETEAKLKRDMEELQRQITEAPARKQEQLRRQATEIMRRHEQTRGSDFFSSIPDKRAYQHNSVMTAGPRGKRKGEQRAAQYQFIALVVLLLIAIVFLLKMLPW
jgi:DNA-binding protein H-NS